MDRGFCVTRFLTYVFGDGAIGGAQGLPAPVVKADTRDLIAESDQPSAFDTGCQTMPSIRLEESPA